jgi:Flp pilus assembly protein TadG
VIVEFAVVIPIFMLLVLALADFALAELSDTAGSNAAREGARIGILYFDDASTTGSPNHDRIAAAVREKLAGNVKGTPTVTVRCLNPDSSPKGGTGVCTSTGANRSVALTDLIEVRVTWTRKGGITGLVGNGTKSDRAVMRIVGKPPTGTPGPAPACTITSATANPASAVRSASGDLPAVTFAVTVSNRAACGGVTLSFPADAGYSGVEAMNETSSGAATFTYTMPAGQGTWTSGSKTITASSNGGAATAPIALDVQDPSVCSLTVTSPVMASQSGGKLTTPATFNVTVSNVATCGTPSLSFPPEAGYASPRTMTPTTGNGFAFQVPITQGTWTSQTYTVGATANNGGTGTISFVVSDQPPCTLTHASPDPAIRATIVLKETGQGTNGQVKTTVTFTINRSAQCTLGAPTITVGPGEGSLKTAQTMTCGTPNALTCTYLLQANTPGWDLTSPRTVMFADPTGASVQRPVDVITG